MLFRQRMVSTIQLNNKHFLQTGKVSDILSDDVLPAESNAKLFIAYIIPQLSLGLCRIIPVFLCKLP